MTHVSTLCAAALDYWVARARGYQLSADEMYWDIPETGERLLVKEFTPHEEWEQRKLASIARYGPGDPKSDYKNGGAALWNAMNAHQIALCKFVGEKYGEYLDAKDDIWLSAKKELEDFYESIKAKP